MAAKYEKQNGVKEQKQHKKKIVNNLKKCSISI